MQRVLESRGELGALGSGREAAEAAARAFGTTIMWVLQDFWHHNHVIDFWHTAVALAERRWRQQPGLLAPQSCE
ncbi:hypothetical protein DUNSADRAFT_13011 [Dunaliella salina]|uniref:Uncharacterized protein n=1 Tax=Dunaliella salina TaxID=3046 RepID=A0ABQ7GA86_DUNSA|nr:hypothetical protein DUNSADRAFT_13011 [Dunaliella salina]|eukprot:KAF5831507.1 hypothetical protein DUNSADRAFT_13011 [Dunaliella salina]